MKRFISFFVSIALVVSLVSVCFIVQSSALNVIYPVDGNYFNLTGENAWSYLPVVSGTRFSLNSGYYFEPGMNGYPIFLANKVRNVSDAHTWILRMQANFSTYGISFPDTFTLYGSFYITSTSDFDFVSEYSGLTFGCGDFFASCVSSYYNNFLYFSVDVSIDSSINFSYNSFYFQFVFKHTFPNMLSNGNLSILGYQCFLNSNSNIPINSFWAHAIDGNGGISIPTSSDHLVFGGQNAVSLFSSNLDVSSDSPILTSYVTNVHDLDNSGSSTLPLFVGFTSDPLYRINSRIYAFTFTLPDSFSFSSIDYHGKHRFTIPLRFLGVQPAVLSVFRADTSSSYVFGAFTSVPFDFNYFCTDSILYDENDHSIYQSCNVMGVESSYSGVQGQGSFYQSYDGSCIVYNNDYNYGIAGNSFGTLTFDWDFSWGNPYIFFAGVDSSESYSPAVWARNSFISVPTPFNNYLDSFDFSDYSSILGDVLVILDNFYRDFSVLYQDFDNYFSYLIGLTEDILDKLSNLDQNIQDLMPQQEADELYDTNENMSRGADSVFDIENSNISSAGTTWNGIHNVIGSSSSAISQLGPTILFCSRIIDSTVDGTSYVYVIFVIPIFIGLLFGIMHRIPNISHAFSSFRKRGDNE